MQQNKVQKSSAQRFCAAFEQGKDNMKSKGTLPWNALNSFQEKLRNYDCNDCKN